MARRVVFGRRPVDGNYGLWVSKPSKDAAYSTDPDDFLFEPGTTLVGVASSQNSGTYVPQTNIQQISAGEAAKFFGPDPSGGSTDGITNTLNCWMATCRLEYSHGLGYTPMVWSDVSPTLSVTPIPVDSSSGVALFYYQYVNYTPPQVTVFSNSSTFGVQVLMYMYTTFSHSATGGASYTYNYSQSNGCYLSRSIKLAALTLQIA